MYQAEMASTTALNGTLEQLALSFIPGKASTSRKAKDSFVRQVRHHTYARTNQFEIEEKLNGLEEKFQILNHDDLSDRLYDLRAELRQHDRKSLPDVLDLLLLLSRHPLNHNRLFESPKNRQINSVPALNWAEIEADDPIDRNDQIWKIQSYSDLSSEEDDLISSSTATSPSRVESDKIDTENEHDMNNLAPHEAVPVHLAERLKCGQFWRRSDDEHRITELQAIREVLFMFQGLPTTLFMMTTDSIRPKEGYHLEHVSQEIFKHFLQSAATLGEQIHSVRRWLTKPKGKKHDQVLENNLRDTLEEFQAAISKFQRSILHPSQMRPMTLTEMLCEVEGKARVLVAIRDCIRETTEMGTARYLDKLFVHICQAQQTCNDEVYDALSQLFWASFDCYIQPVDQWLIYGRLGDSSQGLFIHRTGDNQDPAHLWQGWFHQDDSQASRPPCFLQPLVPLILACGKTVAFLEQLQGLLDHTEHPRQNMSFVLERAAVLCRVGLVPFDAVLSQLLGDHVNSKLATATARLRQVLEDSCGLTKSLDAFDQVYLAKDGVITDNIEAKLFGRIDRLLESWNDRFLVADLVKDAFAGNQHLDVQQFVIHSEHTSSRSMRSRRQSVKILGAITFEYRLPWPIANVIRADSLVSYRRVALLLGQVRRARYMLERFGYYHVHNVTLGEDLSDQKVAQALQFALLQFVNTLYDHLTTCVIQPLSLRMRQELQVAASVDDMIAVHREYMHDLEYACLTAKNLIPIRTALTTMLDLCVRFSDLVSAKTLPARRDSDVEASSFMSARSRKRGYRARSDNSDSSSDENDSDEDNEGYSTFIVPEDMSVITEIRKLKTQFNRNLDFFAAGLRGIGRNSGKHGTLFDLLADRLAWR